MVFESVVDKDRFSRNIVSDTNLYVKEFCYSEETCLQERAQIPCSWLLAAVAASTFSSALVRCSAVYDASYRVVFLFIVYFTIGYIRINIATQAERS